jgi:hypothetical protein
MQLSLSKYQFHIALNTIFFIIIQEESGLDLCQLMLKCFEESYYPVNDDALGIIIIDMQLKNDPNIYTCWVNNL